VGAVHTVGVTRSTLAVGEREEERLVEGDLEDVGEVEGLRFVLPLREGEGLTLGLRVALGEALPPPPPPPPAAAAEEEEGVRERKVEGEGEREAALGVDEALETLGLGEGVNVRVALEESVPLGVGAASLELVALAEPPFTTKPSKSFTPTVGVPLTLALELKEGDKEALLEGLTVVVFKGERLNLAVAVAESVGITSTLRSNLSSPPPDTAFSISPRVLVTMVVPNVAFFTPTPGGMIIFESRASSLSIVPLH